MSDLLGTQEVKQDVMIGFPAYDGKTQTNIAQEMYLGLFDKRVPIRKIHYYNGDSLVTRARNAVASYFLDTPECDYLMFIDSDITFQRWQVKRLREHDKGIVGGMYLKKKLPYQPVCNHKLGQEGDLSIMHEIGTGFMMIRRDVFEAIKERHPERKYKHYKHERQSENYYDFFGVGVDDATGYYLSEDYMFCKYARECGFNIYMDESILVEHNGMMKYPTNDKDLVDGAMVLLQSMHKDAPLEKGMDESVKKLLSVTKKFVKDRGIK